MEFELKLQMLTASLFRFGVVTMIGLSVSVMVGHGMSSFQKVTMF